MKRFNLALMAFLACTGSMQAVDVDVWLLNNTTKVLKIEEKTTGKTVDPGEPNGYIYTISVDPGMYEFSMYDTDGTTFLGSLDLKIEDEENQWFRLYLGNFLVKNTNDDGSAWTEGEDYTLSVNLETQKGDARSYRTGRTSDGKLSMLVSGSDVISGTATPSKKHQDEGYMALSQRKGVTSNETLNLTMPIGVMANITVPSDAELQIGTKSTHFVDFQLFEPLAEKTSGKTKTLSYRVLPSSQINYRTWTDGGLTRAGYFNSAKEGSTDIEFTTADYEAADPKAANHSVSANSGYETGDILLNGNERGHVSLSVGDTFKAHAMRSWQLTDSSVGNYFMEPDFHYTVIGTDGNPLEGVIEISSKPGSAWADIKALAPGTAIVLVTYDAIGVNSYSGDVRSPFMGGEIWGAIWPENTGAYVVTVGQAPSAVVPNMHVNEKYNTGTKKVAGINVDAEHDVFYYLDTEEGYRYTFAPENAEQITVAYPRIGDEMATYDGFSSEGVTRNADGTWTILLRHGRQIVKMTDKEGNAAYQVMRGRKCHREIVNATRPGSKIYQPGDKVKIQYSGLFHPANKLAGIYNMSAYVTYNGIPNGTSLILGKNQYTFGSAPDAQAITVDIPADYDVEANPGFNFSEGVIQVNGYGDPIGNHRLIDPEKGRDANFSAEAHKTYFGAIPDASFSVSPYRSFKINFIPDVAGTELTVVANGVELTAESDGLYQGTFGDYEVTAKKDGYYCLHKTYSIPDDADGMLTFHIGMLKAPEGAWNGKDMTRPQTENGVYHIMNGAELAWFANEVNTNDNTADAELGADIELAGYDWTPAGLSNRKYTGSFSGNNHTVKGIYINNPKKQYQGLFGYIAGNARVASLTTEGEIHGSEYSGAIVGQASENAVIDRCANRADVYATKYPGGLVGYLFSGPSLTNSYNAGKVTASSYAAGLVGMMHTASVSNLYNIGEIVCPVNAAALTGRFAASTAENVFVDREYELKNDYSVASGEQFASGEIAWRLGEAFGQKIGEEAYPAIDGAKVFKVDYTIVSDDIRSVSESSGAESLYTNGMLPAEINGIGVDWFEDAEMTRPVKTVASDATLFARESVVSGISDIQAEQTDARWYNLQGEEIASPSEGSHGVFIRVAGGRATKVII